MKTASFGTLPFVFALALSAPAFAWEASFRGKDHQPESIVVAADGSVIVGSLDRARGRVIKYPAAGGRHLWKRSFGGRPRALALTSTGDAVVAGAAHKSGGQKFLVMKLAANKGRVRWRHLLANAGYSGARDVAVDGADDVVVIGTTGIGAGKAVATAAKLAGTDGALVWRTDLSGTNLNGEHRGTALSFDSTGNVLAATSLSNTGTGSDFTISKLDSATGAEIWRASVAAPSSSFFGDAAFDVLATAGDDVIAGGAIETSGPGTDFVVTRLSGGDGSEMWSTEIDGTIASTREGAIKLALDGDGNVLAFGKIFVDSPASNYSVVKLHGTTGAVLWREDIDGDVTYFHQIDTADMALDPGGDVFLAHTTNTDPPVAAVGRLSGSTGNTLWYEEFPADGLDTFVMKIAVGADGDPATLGVDFDPDDQRHRGLLRIRKLDGTTGAP